MSDGSTPTPSAPHAPFAVGYGNGYGYESVPDAIATEPVDRPTAVTPAMDGATSVIDLDLDPDRTRPMAPVVAPVAPAVAPYAARPAGAAHPRRRLGRGLVLGGLTMLVVGAGIGAVGVASSDDVALASSSAAHRPAATATAASIVGAHLGRDVDPAGPPTTVPVSILVAPTVTRVPRPPVTVPTTAPATVPTTTVTTAPPTTTVTTAPPTTTTPTTTAPPTTTPPPTAPPAGPVFTTTSVPATASCPTPTADVSISFSWSATGTTHVTLSIDGPGVYRTYSGASGSETVSFACNTSHTYLFTAYGANSTVTTTTFVVAPS